MISLDSLALEYGTDKSSKYHNYTPMYENFMSIHRGYPIFLVEIGIGPSGASARMWRDYFPHGNIAMIDDYTEFGGTPREIDGIHIVKGHQDDPEVWEQIPEGLNFVIDDGSHKPKDCITSVNLGFHKLAPGGLWFIEDTHCNFTPVFSEEDILYPWIMSIERTRQLSNLGTGDLYKSLDKMTGLPAMISSIHLYKSVIVLQRV